VLSTLRGAYDGRVHRVFGNGVIRDYAVEFNLLSGVTQALFASSDSILGERFLTYHLVKGVAGDFDDAVKTAIRNVGVESRMRREIAETVAQFLRFSVTSKDLPEIPLPVTDEISALAQMASILRGTVDRDHYRDVLHYRPQHETGTRLAKQLARLLLGLALLHDPPKITALDRQILRRVAFDSCVGFKLELFLEVGREGGLTIAELSSRTGIPSQTARSHVEDLFLLGAFRKELLSPSMRGGSRPSAYYLTDRAVSLWHKSGARRVEVESPEHRQARRQFTRYGRRRSERRQTAFEEINSPLK
jgi:hypothetical protein